MRHPQGGTCPVCGDSACVDETYMGDVFAHCEGGCGWSERLPYRVPPVDR